MEDNKKSGKGRDLGDLKARLGLRKGAGGAAPATGDDQQSTPSPTGQQTILPPPIAGVGPPPPVAAPEQAPPDPRRDPFAAQQQQQAANLAAFYGLGQPLPGTSDTVGGDGAMSKPKPWGIIGGVAGAALVALIVGNAAGRLSSSRTDYNNTIDHAGKIRDELKSMAAQADTINQTINASKDTLNGNIDPALSDKLAAIDVKKPDTAKLFRTNFAKLDDVAIDRLMNFYYDNVMLISELENHTKKTEADKDSLASFAKQAADKAAKGQKTFGITMDLTGAIPLAHFVEIGSPVCNKAGTADCPPAELKGFKYRIDSGAPWGEKPLRGKPGDTITPLFATPFFNSVASGSPDLLAAKDYARRIARIRSLLAKIQSSQKDVLADMDRAAKKPKLVTF